MATERRSSLLSIVTSEKGQKTSFDFCEGVITDAP